MIASVFSVVVGRGSWAWRKQGRRKAWRFAGKGEDLKFRTQAHNQLANGMSDIRHETLGLSVKCDGGHKFCFSASLNLLSRHHEQSSLSQVEKTYGQVITEIKWW